MVASVVVLVIEGRQLVDRTQTIYIGIVIHGDILSASLTDTDTSR